MAPSGENDPILVLAAKLMEAWPRLTAEQQAVLVLSAVDAGHAPDAPRHPDHSNDDS